MKVKNPDGSERNLKEVTNPIAQAVMNEAKKFFDEAESNRVNNWSFYSRCFIRACAAEDCAVRVQQVLTAPHPF